MLLVDRSLGMLEIARQRISSAAGGQLPSNLVLLHADLLDLRLQQCFDTVLSMGMLHLFDDGNLTTLLGRLVAALTTNGRLYLTGLVAEKAIGRCYLSALHQFGEVAAPRSIAQTIAFLSAEPVARQWKVDRDGSMAYFVTA
jgi:cyclopropane fatty-acyl-phospholipid synthase-like methyltransferase